MRGAAGAIELVAQPHEFFPQRVPLVPIAIAIPIRSVLLAPQPLDLSLLPLEFRDQLLSRRRLPARVHARFMARLQKKYKYDYLDLRAADLRHP
jgi:hypothetical protein